MTNIGETTIWEGVVTKISLLPNCVVHGALACSIVLPPHDCFVKSIATCHGAPDRLGTPSMYNQVWATYYAAILVKQQYGKENTTANMVKE